MAFTRELCPFLLFLDVATVLCEKSHNQTFETYSVFLYPQDWISSSYNTDLSTLLIIGKVEKDNSIYKTNILK